MKTLRNITASIAEMTSGESAGGGRLLDIDYAFAPSPFGEVLLAATNKGVCCLFFADDRDETLAEMKKMFPKAGFTRRMNLAMESALAVFGECGDKNVCVPLHLKGTPFQMEVWRALTEIPRGETQTYSEVAVRVGRPKACRATGSAVGANPVSILVPCHRVVPTGTGTGRSVGSVGQYRWGSDRKKTILKSELD